MVDYRSRQERQAGAAAEMSRRETAERRQLTVQNDHRKALAQMNETVADRLAELENKTQAIASHGMETSRRLDTQVSVLNDDISKVHAMIRAGAESDMAMIEQMNRNNTERLNAIVKLIKDI
jgi:predicted  nucleic acid-binding Zn-ribbon protein